MQTFDDPALIQIQFGRIDELKSVRDEDLMNSSVLSHLMKALDGYYNSLVAEKVSATCN